MIKNLALTNFRNFEKKTIEFSEGINVINAENAKGKTNILEAIVFLSLGKSFKARIEAECIKYEEQIARIQTELCITNNELSKNHKQSLPLRDNTEYIIHNTKLEVILTKDVDGWPKKRLLVNGVPRRLIDFAGNIKVTLFAPSDLELVTDSPSLRRNFLDTVLSQSDREYRRAIGSYEKGIRQRNRLLLRIREENISRSNLLFWNQLLIKNGNYISQQRNKFIEFVNAGKFQIANSKLQIKYDPSAISEGRLDQYKEAEIASSTTLVGPHRDDFIFFDSGRELASYGSRGEQRMATLWLKLAEMNFIEEKTGVKPILLLDDIFSELDHSHREIVMQTLNNHQVIITSADPHNIENIKNQMLKIKMINL